MAIEKKFDPDLEWLSFISPVGLVVAPNLLKELGLNPTRQTQADTAAVLELLQEDLSQSALTDPWSFVEKILGWEAQHVAGSPKGPEIPNELFVLLSEHNTTLKPTWALKELGNNSQPWQLLVRIEDAGVDLDARGVLSGWEATPHQRFERLLRDTGVFAGLLITDTTLRLIYAPRGETSGYMNFPIRDLGSVAGRPMLGGLKLLLDSFRLFADADDRRLPALLKKSRDTQASVSTALAEQVLGALHELLRGLDAAEPALIRGLAETQSDHLYEGLLTVLMRLVFILYAEDRDLLPSRREARARSIYETSYSVRGLYAKLVEDATLNPDTMDERRGGWGRLIAVFRLIYGGHNSGFIRARGGKLFDPDEFLFLEGRTAKSSPSRILTVSDGCLLRILEGLMTLKVRGGTRERLSYRTLDVEQIGSVYETVMGFTVEKTRGQVLAIKAGKNNKTPVFVDLDRLISQKGADRIKLIKEDTGRQLTDAQAKPVKAATSLTELAVALDNIVDPRGSPNSSIASLGLPILQPTDERRRTGSHYTPRSLTGPIVRHALEPAFERLGKDATPDQILDLKICDPAMGSGAFLVEACRVIGERLSQAWARWPDTRPKIPADEDEDLHARRLIAQRCLYGVDKNPRAVDLARLSLWLATLARDHEFTFLDHALKCGDSLVGLSQAQISALNWDESKAGLPLFHQLVRERVDEALKGRAEIREAPDDVSRAIQEVRYRTIEQRLSQARLIGDAVIAAFFSADKPKAQEKSRAEIEMWAGGKADELWSKLEQRVASLSRPPHPIIPFHWEIEFPEVFVRENSGFDAIIGNPPFAGKNTVIAGNKVEYIPWLQTLHKYAHGNADLVAHFFRHAFSLLRQDGVFGLIATNTIGQGDTRATGLMAILSQNGSILRATRRLKWPGDAAVVVSVVHLVKGSSLQPILDGHLVKRISAYLVDGDLDTSPSALAANSGKAFQGSIILGAGFTFDDLAAAKSTALSLSDMNLLIAKNPKNANRIFPYIGGEEVNTTPRHTHHRYVIDFFDRPLGRRSELKEWAIMSVPEKSECLTCGIVPLDYPNEVAEDWPELIEIVRRFVKPDRDSQSRKALRERWWQYAEKRPGLYRSIAPLKRVFVNSSKASPQYAIAMLEKGFVYSQNLNVFAMEGFAAFSILQSSVHEIWARFVGTTLEDRLTYVKDDCFESFPFPFNFEIDNSLRVIGESYYKFRADMMIRRNVGLTKFYNSFHSHNETDSEILRVRTLHTEMDIAVLEAYDWKDLAKQSQPRFIEQDADEGKSPKTRFDWPTEFKDEVLARLLALNVERAAAEHAEGLTVTAIEDEDAQDAEEDSE